MSNIPEEDVLVCILNNKNLHFLLLNKVGNPFRKRSCQVIYYSVMNFLKKYKKPPSKRSLINIVKDFLANSKSDSLNSAEYFNLIDRIYNKDVDIEYTGDLIIDYVKKQLLRNMIESIELESPSLEDLEYKIKEIKEIGVDEFVEREDSFFVEEVDRRSVLYESDLIRQRIASPWKELNQYIRGGFGLGDEIVLVGFTGMGKSTILSYIAGFTLTQGYGVKIFSLENSLIHVCEMLDSYFTGRPREEIRLSFSDQIKDELKNSFKKYKIDPKACSITTFLPHRVTLDVIEEQLKRDLEEIPNLKMVVIDWGDCIVPKQRYSEKRHEFASVFHGIKALARKYNLVILTATMSNSDSLYQYRVNLKSISESRAKAYMAQLILVMCQVEEEKNNSPSLFRFNIAKNTWGRSEVYIPMKIEYDKTLVEYNENWETDKIKLGIASKYEWERKRCGHESKPPPSSKILSSESGASYTKPDQKSVFNTHYGKYSYLSGEIGDGLIIRREGSINI